MALVFYILNYSIKGDVPGFQLAIISTIFGGFMLSSSIFGRAASDLKLRMRRIGAIYLISAVAFVIFTVFYSIVDMMPQETIIDKLMISERIIIDLPYVTFSMNPQAIATWITMIFMLIGITALAIAMWSMLIFIIPKLLRKSRSDII